MSIHLHNIIMDRRLSSSAYLFPGKKLKIPPKAPTPPPKEEEDSADTSKPPPPPRSVVEEDEYLVPGAYIKVNVKRVTQGHGCIHGCVLLTAKSLMFCPNPTDPAVHEFQRELRDNFFEIIAPSDLVLAIAVYRDLRFEAGFGEVADRDNPRDDAHLLYVPKKREKKEEEDEKENEGATTENEKKEEEEPPEEDQNKKIPLKLDEDEGDAYEPDEPGLPDPLYLRVTMGKPAGKRLDRDAGILSDGEQDLRPHYWFMIRPARARKLHQFVEDSFPGRYGLLDHAAAGRRGYEVIREGEAILEAEAGRGANRASIAQLARQMHETFTSVDLDNCSRQVRDREGSLYFVTLEMRSYPADRYCDSGITVLSREFSRNIQSI